MSPTEQLRARLLGQPPDRRAVGLARPRCSSPPSAASCASGTSAARTSWSSTRRTTSSRAGRCSQFGIETRVPDTINEAGRDVHQTHAGRLRRPSRRPRRPPARRQVAHRLAASSCSGSTNSLRLALRGRAAGHPVDPHDRPRRPAAVRLDLLGTVAAARCSPSRGTTSSTPAPACSTSSSCSGRSRRSAPCSSTATSSREMLARKVGALTGAGARRARPAGRAVAGLAAVAAGSPASCLGLCGGHEVVGPATSSSSSG